MLSRYFQSSYLVTEDVAVSWVSAGPGGTINKTVPAGTEQDTLEDWATYLTALFASAWLSFTFDTVTGKLTVVDVDGSAWTLTIGSSLFAAHLGLTTVEAHTGDYTGAVVPSFWTGNVKRDWGYSPVRTVAKTGFEYGTVRYGSPNIADAFSLWASYDTSSDWVQLYTFILYTADGRTFTDDDGRKFIIGDQQEFSQTLVAPPMLTSLTLSAIEAT